MECPIDANRLEALLTHAKYNTKKKDYLIDCFRNGFSLGYEGKEDVQINSPNLKIRVGDEIDLWNKVMKEVKLKRYAGPFEEIPYEHYIQSPIGLVPKDSGKDTRLIFHLSYPKRKNSTSVNANTPKHLCEVKYPDFSEAIKLCLKEGKMCFISRSDVRSAFRNLSILMKHWKYLIMKAKNPIDKKWYFFVDKNLPFGASISCKHFQDVSDCIAYLVAYETQKDLVNYLDDFLFVALMELICNNQIDTFLKICGQIGMPVSLEKTFRATNLLTFLGFLIDTINQVVLIPKEKITKAINTIQYVLNKAYNAKHSKITVLQLQKICGYLNFLGRAILPGRAFTRRLYAPLKNHNLKPHHHIRINGEMKLDLRTWLVFLQNNAIFCRGFMDFSKKWNAEEISFYMDASKNRKLGFGGFCEQSWMQYKWMDIIEKYDPSIEYLELYAVVAGVLAWIHRFANKRIILFTDNESAQAMINKTSSNCKNCMVLIRILVLHSMIHNVRIYAKHVSSSDNGIADSLSRFQNERFRRLTRELNFEEFPTMISSEIWPINKIWIK